MKKLIINPDIDVLEEIKVVRDLYKTCDFSLARHRMDLLIKNIEKAKN